MPTLSPPWPPVRGRSPSSITTRPRSRYPGAILRLDGGVRFDCDLRLGGGAGWGWVDGEMDACISIAICWLANEGEVAGRMRDFDGSRLVERRTQRDLHRANRSSLQNCRELMAFRSMAASGPVARPTTLRPCWTWGDQVRACPRDVPFACGVCMALCVCARARVCVCVCVCACARALL